MVCNFIRTSFYGEGLTFGVWTAPFEVTSRAWVYEHHKDWLVHNANGDPIPIGDVWGQKTDTLYALDTTHPGARVVCARLTGHSFGSRGESRSSN